MQGNIPKRYRTEFIEPGVVNYDDVGQGKVLVLREALDKMKESYIGKPVVNVEHKDLSMEEAFKLSDEDLKSLADGIIYGCGWLDNGWMYADMIIWDLETQKNIDDRGFSTSCAYLPTEAGAGGKWHNLEYDEEVLNGVGTHMAIVKNPRYEKAKIYELPKEFRNSLSDELIGIYKNSKENKNMGKRIFKFFMPKTNEGEKTEEEEKINAKDAMVEIDGKEVPLANLIANYQEDMEKEKKKENILNPEDEVEIDGKKVSVENLVKSYQKNAKKNAEPPTDETAEDVVDETAQKSNEGEEDDEEKEQKKNNFKKMQNAISKIGSEFKVSVNTRDDRLKTGRERYSLGGEK